MHLRLPIVLPNEVGGLGHIPQPKDVSHVAMSHKVSSHGLSL
jgi:hypothetical protein